MLTKQYLNELKIKLEGLEKLHLTNINQHVNILQSTKLLIHIRTMLNIVRQTSWEGHHGYYDSITRLKCMFAYQPHHKDYLYKSSEDETFEIEKQAMYEISMLLLSEAGKLKVRKVLLKPLLRLLDS